MMIFDGDVSRSYINWICKELKMADEDAGAYQKLLYLLLEMDFLFRKNSLDSNRAEDGIALRERYVATECGDLMPPYFVNDDCSILEMLAAFAIKIETDIMGDPGSDCPVRWFRIMIETLGLTPYTDLNFDEEAVRDALDYPLVLFPGASESDELWMQMQKWINQTFPI